LKVSGFLTEWLVVQALLTPAVAPGQCLPLDGTTGYVDIRLHHPVYLTGFSLEHIPAAIAYNVSSAPNKVSLLALSPPQTHKVKGGLFTPVRTHGPYRYDVEANSAVQTFSIFSETPEPVSFVRLQVRCYLLWADLWPIPSFCLCMSERESVDKISHAVEWCGYVGELANTIM
jgi:hypothetical protein